MCIMIFNPSSSNHLPEEKNNVWVALLVTKNQAVNISLELGHVSE